MSQQSGAVSWEASMRASNSARDGPSDKEVRGVLSCERKALRAHLPSPALSHAAFDYHSSLCLTLVFSPIPKPSSLVSWSQICLLNSIAVFETVRSYQLKIKSLVEVTLLHRMLAFKFYI